MGGGFGMKGRGGAAAAVLFAAVLAVSGCAGGGEGAGGADTSRVRLYSSTSDLAADSALVVTGTVVGQQAVVDLSPDLGFTLSTVRLNTVVKGDAAPGSAVVVRQVGSEERPTDLMAVGSHYLLYLTPSGLPGDLGEQYYVTGGNAGLYEAAGGNALGTSGDQVYTRSAPEPGENLPGSLTPAQALGNSS